MYTTHRFYAVRATVLFFLLSSPGMSFSQCSNLPTREISKNFRYGPVESRCEGFYMINASNELKLVSFTYGLLSYEIDDLKKVTLSFSKKPNDQSLNLRAISFNRKAGYRLDRDVTNDKQFIWDLNQFVLSDYDMIPSSCIGLFSWIGTENNKSFLPVQIDDGRDNCLLKLRVNEDIKAYKYVLTNSENCFVAIDQYLVVEAKHFRNDVLTIPIDGEYTGPYCLNVFLELEDSGWQDVPITFNLSF